MNYENPTFRSWHTKFKQLFSNLETVCQRLQIDYDPEYIKDMSRVISMGLQGKTILLIDGEVAFMKQKS